MAPKVLVVLSSAGKTHTGEPTGWWLGEFAHPYDVLTKEGQTEITVASPAGGAAPLDPKSVAFATENKDKISENFLNKHKDLWEKTVPLSSIKGHANEYEAIFFVGGHGPMFDLASDKTSQDLIREFYNKNKIIAAVCHGPVALAQVELDDGKKLLEGQMVTGLTDSEERGAGVQVPFSLEKRLDIASGGGFVRSENDWEPKVVISRHGRLITGQNPASATGVGQAIYDAIFGDVTTADAK